MIDQISILETIELPTGIRQKLEGIFNSEFAKLFNSASVDALFAVIKYCLENGWSEERLDNWLFNPIKPTTESINIYRQKHEEIYAKESIDIARIIDESTDQFFAITSGMYGGKSTLADDIVCLLKDKDYRDITMVPDFMGHFVTIRGRESKEGEEIGEDGFTRKEAVKFFPDLIKQIFDEFNINPNEKVIMHFDEATFLKGIPLEIFIDFVRDNYPNVKVMFVGLNTNFLGKDLEGYNVIKDVMSQEFKCKSFVPQNEVDYPTAINDGTHTTRFVIFPDGQHLRDFGFLPEVVTKENSHLVYYTPSTFEEHLSGILTSANQQELVSRLFMFTPTDAHMQDELLRILSCINALES